MKTKLLKLLKQVFCDHHYLFTGKIRYVGYDYLGTYECDKCDKKIEK